MLSLRSLADAFVDTVLAVAESDIRGAAQDLLTEAAVSYVTQLLTTDAEREDFKALLAGRLWKECEAAIVDARDAGVEYAVRRVRAALPNALLVARSGIVDVLNDLTAESVSAPAGVAQQAERPVCTRDVAGSTPVPSSLDVDEPARGDGVSVASTAPKCPVCRGSGERRNEHDPEFPFDCKACGGSGALLNVADASDAWLASAGLFRRASTAAQPLHHAGDDVRKRLEALIHDVLLHGGRFFGGGFEMPSGMYVRHDAKLQADLTAAALSVLQPSG